MIFLEKANLKDLNMVANKFHQNKIAFISVMHYIYCIIEIK